MSQQFFSTGANGRYAATLDSIKFINPPREPSRVIEYEDGKRRAFSELHKKRAGIMTARKAIPIGKAILKAFS